MYLKVKGYPVAFDHTSDDNHIYIHVVAADHDYSAAVNVASNLPHSVLTYHFVNFGDDVFAMFQRIAEGEHPATLDYWKDKLVDASKMETAVATGTPDNPLGLRLISLTKACMDEPDNYVVIYGKKWGPKPDEDWVFHFSPAQGIHDIHCNQSSPEFSKWRAYDKPNQDGAIFFVDVKNQSVVGLFSMFREVEEA